MKKLQISTDKELLIAAGYDPENLSVIYLRDYCYLNGELATMRIRYTVDEVTVDGVVWLTGGQIKRRTRLSTLLTRLLRIIPVYELPAELAAA